MTDERVLMAERLCALRDSVQDTRFAAEALTHASPDVVRALLAAEAKVEEAWQTIERQTVNDHKDQP